jgi:hypothetical protein
MSAEVREEELTTIAREQIAAQLFLHTIRSELPYRRALAIMTWGVATTDDSRM